VTRGDRDTIDWNCQGCGRPYLTDEGLPGMSNWEVDGDGIPSAKHHCPDCGVEIISPVGYGTDRSVNSATEQGGGSDE